MALVSNFLQLFHPQTNEQTEVVNRNLGDLPKCGTGKKQGTWDLTLLLVEFAYNNAVNRSTRKSPLRLSMGISPAPLLTFFPPPDARVSQPASTFTQHIHDLHAEIRRKIAMTNDSYNFQLMCIAETFLLKWVTLLWLVFNLNDYPNTPTKGSTLEPWVHTRLFGSWDLMHMCLSYLTTWVLVLFSMWNI